jgi:ABC-2 type transport system permease protein
MRVFRAFVAKEFRHIFRDRRTLMVLFGMPMAQLFLFGYAITTEVSNANLAIYNQSPGQFSSRLIEKLTASGFFRLKETVHSREAMLQVFRESRAKLVVVIPPDFEERVARGEGAVQLIADGSDPNLANTLTASARGIIETWMRENAPATTVQVETVLPMVRWHYNPDLRSAPLFVPGVVTLVLMLVSAMLSSISITREKELGTIEILYVSPLKPPMIILGKLVPFALLSLLNSMVILLVARLVFEVPLNGSAFLLVAECMLFILTALSLGVLISTVARSQQTALMLSLFALMLPTILLSGFIFPISNMPVPLQVISNIIPAKWFLIIIKGIMLQGVGFDVLWNETLILALMTLGLIGVSTRKLKTRLQ